MFKKLIQNKKKYFKFSSQKIPKKQFKEMNEKELLLSLNDFKKYRTSVSKVIKEIRKILYSKKIIEKLFQK